MRLFVGLGNPGAQYARNRHNIGFMALDRIAADHGFAPWRSRFQGLVAEGRLGAEKVILLKPATFMNLSGQAVGAAMRYLKLGPEDLIVFHDELDLAPGKCRFKAGGGHAGHNGLRSIHAHVGPDYRRVRLGIGHPGHKDRVAAYVLHDFARADDDWLAPLLTGISEGAPDLAAGAEARFLNAVSLRVAPPRSSGGSGRDGQEGGGPRPAAPDDAPRRATERRTGRKPGANATDPGAAAGDDGEKRPPESAPANPLQRLVEKFR